MERLIKALKANKNVADYRVVVSEKRSCELFYVQKKVETERATHTFAYNVTLYIDKDGKRGQSSFAYYPYLDDEALAKLIEENIFAAGFTLNQYFPQPGKEDYSPRVPEGNLASVPFQTLIKEIGEAIFKADNKESLSLSATEVFLNKFRHHIINSQGVDYEYEQYECRIETIPNFDRGDEEFELYQDYSFSSFDAKELTEKVEETLKLCKDRAYAVPLKDVGNLPIILEGEEVAQFFNAFIHDLNYQTVYAHANRYNIGDAIQENPKGDKMNIELRPEVAGAIASRQVDGDGVILKPVEIIKDGKAVSRHGSFMFGYYLGEKHPTGVVPVACVAPGKSDLEEEKKSPYLRCVRFSGLQADPFSGFLGGEVRLGYYFDGEKEIPVTGISIQGNLFKAKDEYKASKKCQTLENFYGPKYLYIPDFKIVQS